MFWWGRQTRGSAGPAQETHLSCRREPPFTTHPQPRDRETELLVAGRTPLTNPDHENHIDNNRLTIVFSSPLKQCSRSHISRQAKLPWIILRFAVLEKLAGRREEDGGGECDRNHSLYIPPFIYLYFVTIITFFPFFSTYVLSVFFLSILSSLYMCLPGYLTGSWWSELIKSVCRSCQNATGEDGWVFFPS